LTYDDGVALIFRIGPPIARPLAQASAGPDGEAITEITEKEKRL
jgi:hypothetical protein